MLVPGIHWNPLAMSSFSIRRGIVPPKSIAQTDSMDRELRIGLWNALTIHYWNLWNGRISQITHSRPCAILCHLLYVDFWKKPIDTMPGWWEQVHKEIREYFYVCKWYEVYDFIEFVVATLPDDLIPGATYQFRESCNVVLERELSGYRLVGAQFTPITSEEEVEAITSALGVPESLKPVREHLDAALRMLSDRKTPDYRNSIKESISAVEALCQIIVGRKATLGEALKTVETKVALHGALKGAFSSLYGYTSDAQGIRHALMDEQTLSVEDAKFMLVSCAAFVNYLVAKSAAAGLKL